MTPKAKKPSLMKPEVLAELMRMLPKAPEFSDGLARLREGSKTLFFVMEEEYIWEELEKCDWNLNETAREIGCPVTSLQRALERHPEIDRERQRMSRQLGWLRRRKSAA